MNIVELSLAIVLALILGLVFRKEKFSYVLLAVSVAGILVFQNATGAGEFTFFLPMGTLGIAILGWAATAPPGTIRRKENWIAVCVILIVVVLYYGAGCFGSGKENFLFDFPFPGALIFLAGLIFFAGWISALALLLRWRGSFLWAGVIGILLLLIALKAPSVNLALSQFGLGLAGAGLSKLEPLPWLGFSYVAFRVLHTIRDRQTGRLPAASLAEYVSYVIFFPSFVAGPIDRLERFLGDVRSSVPMGNDDWLFAGSRIFGGLFKKFVIANGLALISLSPKIANGSTSTAWMWFFVYMYSLQIYFDFSGYTDIAIGTARLMGIRLPENFNAPYLKPNLTQFWNHWHMTLTQWFRAYFFNPLSRALRSLKIQPPAWLLVLVMQMMTMTLIGLWHGITINFALWGVWHGAGLFVHNRWSDVARTRVEAWASTPARKMLVNGAGVMLTFNFVAVGWVFFALPSLDQSLRVLSILFGIS